MGLDPVTGRRADPLRAPVPSSRAPNGTQAAANAGALGFALTGDEIDLLNDATVPFKN